MAEFEGFVEFDNDLVTNEVLGLQAPIDNQTALKERESDKKDDIASRTIKERIISISKYYALITL